MKQKKQAPEILQYILDQSETLIQNTHQSTGENYRKTHNSLKRYLAASHYSEHLTFADLTETHVNQYEKWLIEQGLMHNSIFFYMSIFRACYNRAYIYPNGLCEDTRQHRIFDPHRPSQSVPSPFRSIHIHPQATGKRSVPPETVRQLRSLSLPSIHLAQARDLFLFQLFTHGMPFVDVYHLRWGNITDHEITYHRSKTRTEVRIRLEPEIRSLIERYTTPDHKPSDYVFPHLHTCCRYSRQLSSYNYQLRQLSDAFNGLHQPPVALHLTSYVARHTWASQMIRLGAKLPEISQGLGHTSLRYTETYIRPFQPQAIDASNRLCIDSFQVIDTPSRLTT